MLCFDFLDVEGGRREVALIIPYLIIKGAGILMGYGLFISKGCFKVISLQ